MIKIKHRGSFNHIKAFFDRAKKLKIEEVLSKYGREGVDALSAATPIDTGITASSWSFKIEVTRRGYSISWHNSNVVNEVPIAIILQYGHATRNGGYVQGRDYINPSLRPIFDKISDAVWREVTKL